LLVMVRQHLGDDPDAVLPVLGRYVELECTLDPFWKYRVNGGEFDLSNLYRTSPFFWRIMDAVGGSLRALRRSLALIPIQPPPPNKIGAWRLAFTAEWLQGGLFNS